MAEDKDMTWRERRQAQRNRNMLLAIIPLIIIILVIVVRLAGRSEGNDKEELSQTTESAAESVPESLWEAIEPVIIEQTETVSGEFTPTHLLKDEMPQINQLMEAYFQARVKCDAETLYKLYGRTDTNGMEQERARMVLNASYIESFDNIVCYTTEAEDTQTWLVYASSDIKFRAAATPAPAVMWCFVTVDEEDNYTIIDPQNLTPEQEAFREEVALSEDARNLALQINTRLAKAVKEDPDLATIYGTLNAGSPLWETGETETPPEVQVLPE